MEMDYEYKWKVVKATVNQPDRNKFFYSDKNLMNYLEKVLDSYEEEGYYNECGYYGNDVLQHTIKNVISTGNEKIEADGTGIRDIVKLK